MTSLSRSLTHTRADSLSLLLRTLFERFEHWKIRTHLGIAIRMLERADVRTLSDTQRDARQRHITSLWEYMARGLFPQNTLVPNKTMPVFVDHRGVHCAMGYVMHKDGRDDLVAGIVRKNNLIYVDDISGGPVATWLTGSGLSQAEAAWVQPNYGGDFYLFRGLANVIALIVSFIVSGIFLILLEWLAVKIVRKFAPIGRLRKVAAFLGFTAIFVLATLAFFVFFQAFPGDWIRDFVRNNPGIFERFR